MDDILIVYTTLRDVEQAEILVRNLIELKLIACATILPAVQSIYRWQDIVEKESETLVMLKTVRAQYASLEAAIRAMHPYAVPELLAVPVTFGMPEYLTWVRSETR